MISNKNRDYFAEFQELSRKYRNLESVCFGRMKYEEYIAANESTQKKECDQYDVEYDERYDQESEEEIETVGGHIIPHSQGQHNSPPDVSYFVL
jgi:hypothetical protein